MDLTVTLFLDRYTFKLLSDDNSAMYLNDGQWINNMGIGTHSQRDAESGWDLLDAGVYYKFNVYFGEATGNSGGIVFSWKCEGGCGCGHESYSTDLTANYFLGIGLYVVLVVSGLYARGVCGPYAIVSCVDRTFLSPHRPLVDTLTSLFCG